MFDVDGAISCARSLLDQLPKKLSYHDANHAEEVVRGALEISEAMEIDERSQNLITVAGYFHDLGFLKKYHENEVIACSIAKEYLPQFGFFLEDIEIIQELIMATRLPQSPQRVEAKILCDADLDNLGRDDFFIKMDLLFDEMKSHDCLLEKVDWYEKTYHFLDRHEYFTEWSRRMRGPKKNENKSQLGDLLVSMGRTL